MILFYAANDRYGSFSNFSRHQVTIYNRTWRTSEHAFQAMKFDFHPAFVKKVWEAKTPGQAAKIGRSRSSPFRKDWDDDARKMLLRIEDVAGIPSYNYRIAPPNKSVDSPNVLTKVKDVYMYEIVYAKFTQNKDLRKELLGTGDEIIVENAEFDPYWGWGASKVGRNKLGRILMMVRTAISTNSGVPLVVSGV